MYVSDGVRKDLECVSKALDGFRQVSDVVMKVSDVVK